MHERVSAVQDRISPAALGRLRLRLRPLLCPVAGVSQRPAEGTARHDAGHHDAARPGQSRGHSVGDQDFGCALSADEWRIAARLQAEGMI